MPFSNEIFGQFWRQDVHLYTLENSGGMQLKVTDYGCIMTELHVPGRDGAADVLLGFDDFYEYVKGHSFFGAVVGRYANRIAEGRFTLDGTEYQLTVNNPAGYHMHGGFRGFDKYIWSGEAGEDGNGPYVVFNRTSHDGEERYPGNLDISITYRLGNDNVLSFDVEATTDRATPINVVQHAYFNLAGHDSGDTLGHVLSIEADAYTPADELNIPTGVLKHVGNTPYDLREPVKLDGPTAEIEGFDTNFVLRNEPGSLGPCARLHDPESGRTMTVRTTAPGLQFYSGHKLLRDNGKGGVSYGASAGLCLEAQEFPNAINVPSFPQPVLRPGETYRHRTEYAFSVE